MIALGNFICRPPWSLGKVKSAVDVLGDICQASLLHLIKAAVSRLNSFSGQIITGPEKASRGARVHSISLKLFRSKGLYFPAKNMTILSFHPLRIAFGWCIEPLVVSYAQESDWCSAMDYFQVSSFVLETTYSRENASPKAYRF